MIDQHQRLQPMHPCVAVTKSLPASLLDQPASRQFHLTVGLRITDQLGVTIAQRLSSGSRHQRILEEAPGVAQLLWIRQFFTADGTNSSAHILRGRYGNPLLRQTLADRPILKMQRCVATQRETHSQNQKTPWLLFEQTVAITECAVVLAELTEDPSFTIQCSESCKYVLDLDTVGTDVLDW